MSFVAQVGPMTLSFGGEVIGQLDGIEISDVIENDLYGTGEPGILWSSDPRTLQWPVKTWDAFSNGLRRTAEFRFAPELSSPRNRHERRRQAALARR